jgi:hypothetical protein
MPVDIGLTRCERRRYPDALYSHRRRRHPDRSHCYAVVSTWFGARSPPPFQIPPSGKKDPSKPLGIEKRRFATCSRCLAKSDRVRVRSRRVGVTPDCRSLQNRAATRWRHAVGGVRTVMRAPRGWSGQAPWRRCHENLFSHATSSSSVRSSEPMSWAFQGRWSSTRGLPCRGARVAACAGASRDAAARIGRPRGERPGSVRAGRSPRRRGRSRGCRVVSRRFEGWTRSRRASHRFAPGVVAVAPRHTERVGSDGESCGPHRNSLERSSWREQVAGEPRFPGRGQRVIRVSPTANRHARVSMKNSL